eukprot:scaffold2017_cov387-Prasinococcus_capsulatus_cf.AAC.20
MTPKATRRCCRGRRRWRRRACWRPWGPWCGATRRWWRTGPPGRQRRWAASVPSSTRSTTRRATAPTGALSAAGPRMMADRSCLLTSAAACASARVAAKAARATQALEARLRKHLLVFLAPAQVGRGRQEQVEEEEEEEEEVVVEARPDDAPFFAPGASFEEMRQFGLRYDAHMAMELEETCYAIYDMLHADAVGAREACGRGLPQLLMMLLLAKPLVWGHPGAQQGEDTAAAPGTFFTALAVEQARLRHQNAHAVAGPAPGVSQRALVEAARRALASAQASDIGATTGPTAAGRLGTAEEADAERADGQRGAEAATPTERGAGPEGGTPRTRTVMLWPRLVASMSPDFRLDSLPKVLEVVQASVALAALRALMCLSAHVSCEVMLYKARTDLAVAHVAGPAAAAEEEAAAERPGLPHTLRDAGRRFFASYTTRLARLDEVWQRFRHAADALRAGGGRAVEAASHLRRWLRPDHEYAADFRQVRGSPVLRATVPCSRGRFGGCGSGDPGERPSARDGGTRADLPAAGRAGRLHVAALRRVLDGAAKRHGGREGGRHACACRGTAGGARRRGGRQGNDGCGGGGAAGYGGERRQRAAAARSGGRGVAHSGHVCIHVPASRGGAGALEAPSGTRQGRPGPGGGAAAAGEAAGAAGGVPARGGPSARRGGAGGVAPAAAPATAAGAAGAAARGGGRALGPCAVLAGGRRGAAASPARRLRAPVRGGLGDCSACYGGGCGRRPAPRADLDAPPAAPRREHQQREGPPP